MTTRASLPSADHMCNVEYTQVMVSNRDKKKSNYHAQQPHNKTSWNLNTQMHCFQLVTQHI